MANQRRSLDHLAQTAFIDLVDETSNVVLYQDEGLALIRSIDWRTSCSRSPKASMRFAFVMPSNVFTDGRRYRRTFLIPELLWLPLN
ncbi:MAG: hypothetical protein ACR2FO_02300 [Actinomycetota bacterium]